MTMIKAKAVEFAALDQVIPGGVTALETDTGRRKTGDGVTRWKALAYNQHNVYVDSDSGQVAVDGAPLAPSALPAVSGAGNYTLTVFDYYANSKTGSDNNPGTRAAPFASLTKLASKGANGLKFGLARGSYWRDQIDLSGYSGCTIGGYGTTDQPLPCVDGADIAANSAFTLASSQTKTYQITWTHQITNGYVQVWENGTLLAFVASIANCESTPGSFYISGATGGLQTAAGSITVYVHPTGDTVPTSDGKKYELTTRNYGAKVGFDSASLIDGLWTRRPGHADGSQVGYSLTRGIAEDGTKQAVSTLKCNATS